MVNLILDLDETLIHTIVTYQPDPNLEKKSDFNFRFSADGPIYYVFKRPGLDEFLNESFKRFSRVGIWTAADRHYAKMIIKKILNYQQIMNLDFVFSRDFCESDQIGTIKPLSKIYQNYPTWKPKETIMVDNSAQVLRDNPLNGIVAIDFAEPHLSHDIYLYLLTDIFRESLPKTSVYQFVDRVNKVIPYIVSLYQMGDTHRNKDLKETLKIHPIAGISRNANNGNNRTNNGAGNGGGNRTNSGPVGNLGRSTLEIGLNVQRLNKNTKLPALAGHNIDMKAIKNPIRRKALLLKHFK